MAEKGKEPTKEEIAQIKAKQRDYALKNLEAGLVDIGASYLVYKDKGYGNNTNYEMRDYKYAPAYAKGIKAVDENGEEYDVVYESLAGSREEGEIYSGNLSETKIMKDCAAIIQESASRIKISDLIKLMGAEMNLKEEYKEMHVGDLIPKKLSKEEFSKLSDDEKKARKASEEFYKKLIGSYQDYLVKTKVGEASLQSAKQASKGLEEILAKPKEEKK